MESAIHDLTRELDAPPRPPAPELLDEVEVEVVDDLLLDPWFWRSEEEFAEIKDDPTAKIVEIKTGTLKTECDYRPGFDDSRWVF